MVIELDRHEGPANAVLAVQPRTETWAAVPDVRIHHDVRAAERFERATRDHPARKARHLPRNRDPRIAIECSDSRIPRLPAPDEPSEDGELFDIVEEAISAFFDRRFRGGPKIWIRAESRPLPGALACEPPNVAHELTGRRVVPRR